MRAPMSGHCSHSQLKRTFGCPCTSDEPLPGASPLECPYREVLAIVIVYNGCEALQSSCGAAACRDSSFCATHKESSRHQSPTSH